MIDLKTLKQLVKLMSDNNLTELDLEDGGEKVKLRRQGETPDVQYVAAPAAAPAPAAAHASASAAAPVPAAESAAPAAAAEPAGATIDSPMVGTYYSSPSPDAKPFVAAGDRVDADTVVCIVEAMKVFNEIKAEKSGTIRKLLVENGQAVEFGQPILEIDPD